MTAGHSPRVQGSAVINASDNPDFSVHPISHQEHVAAIDHAMKSDPAHFSTVSAPEEHPSHQSWAIRDKAGTTHGVYYTAPDEREPGARYIGGLANISPTGVKGISKVPREANAGVPTYGEGYDLPHVYQNYHKQGAQEVSRTPFAPEYAPKDWDYAKHGTPDYMEYRTPARHGAIAGE